MRHEQRALGVQPPGRLRGHARHAQAAVVAVPRAGVAEGDLALVGRQRVRVGDAVEVLPRRLGAEHAASPSRARGRGRASRCSSRTRETRSSPRRAWAAARRWRRARRTVMYSQYSSCTARRPVSPQSASLRAISSPTQNAGLPGSPGHFTASLRRGSRSAPGSSEKKRVLSARGLRVVGARDRLVPARAQLVGQLVGPARSVVGHGREAITGHARRPVSGVPRRPRLRRARRAARARRPAARAPASSVGLGACSAPEQHVLGSRAGARCGAPPRAAPARARRLPCTPKPGRSARGAAGVASTTDAGTPTTSSIATRSASIAAAIAVAVDAGLGDRAGRRGAALRRGRAAGARARPARRPAAAPPPSAARTTCLASRGEPLKHCLSPSSCRARAGAWRASCEPPGG